MPTPKERLSHLLELAAQGQSERAALAGEVADLLLDWPAQYPPAMRATFEALLEKIAREMDDAACADLAARFDGRNDFSAALLNAFFLVAQPSMKDMILARSDGEGAIAIRGVDADTLLREARARRDFASALAHLSAIPETVAAAILADGSGRALAAACKGAGINRATYSAIAILAGPARSVHDNFELLAVYDRVPENGAMHLLAYWRSRSDGAHALAAAAE